MKLVLPRQRELNLERCKLMAILNITPDSFSDGGKFVGVDAALRQVASMLADGADIIDVGGESTRPGAIQVPLQQELDRVLPVIELIRREFDTVISVDTYKATVMTEAIAAGADIINDIKALQEQGALAAAAKLQVPVCLMHMQGQPDSMQQAPQYRDVITEVSQFLQARIRACVDAGIAPSQLILDPGFGFGKTMTHNYQLLARLGELGSSGLPVLAGMSRKSMIGQLLNRNTSERLAGSIACATIAVMHGARIIRAHDVRETADAIAVAQATFFGEQV
ncbi:dihydropteroate synthase [Rheinheimera sp. SA_1]|uniref:dihydropteroate synthase n=1 Tax=Rheinheimera sp. SA_1 TaxID=1827365 RepID=UPI0007FC548D|nr:dihydropteroate synthase [Rheinheimera sp. SA_1]OBP15967.1 dihydropteroate synthase [Rheinheimera sp. SA_1]